MAKLENCTVKLMLARDANQSTVGQALGVAEAFGATHLIQYMLFQTEAADPVTFVAVSVFLSVVATVANLIP